MDEREVFATFKAAKKDADTYTITASTPSIDRDDEIIMPSAFKASLPAYLKSNPVILWMHDMWSPPIARAVGGSITDSAFQLDIKFASTEFAQTIKTLVDEGMLNTVSVGGSVRNSTTDSEGRRVVTDLELWETSIVTVPSNRDAVIQRAKSMGVSIPKYERESEDRSKQASSDKAKMSDAEKIKRFAKGV